MKADVIDVPNLVVADASGVGLTNLMSHEEQWFYGDDPIGPTVVSSDLSDATSVTAGNGHYLFLRRDGTVMAWGSNIEGGATVPAGLTDVVAVAAGGYHSVALKRDGTLVCWGRNREGQLDIPAGLV